MKSNLKYNIVIESSPHYTEYRVYKHSPGPGSFWMYKAKKLLGQFETRKQAINFALNYKEEA